MNITEAFKTVRPLVVGKVKHQHYDHVVKLTELTYRPMITGKNADHLIQRFNKREDEEAHKQRMRLTQLITPSISNSLPALMPFIM